MPVFVDSNVLVYGRDPTDLSKQQRASHWIDSLWRSRSGRLSTQVLQEFYVTATAKLKPALPEDVARAAVRHLLAWQPVLIDAEIVESAWALQDHHSLSFWDALILSAATRAGCETLLTEDLTHGATYGEVTVVNPFRQAPAS